MDGADPLVVGAWGHVASGYTAYWSPRFRPFLEDALRAFSPGPGPIAVPGCGPGDEALVLAERYPDRQVLATDPAEPMLAILRSRATAANLQVEAGSAVDLPSQIQDAGGVFSSFNLQLLPDRAAGLAAWVQALGPGGTVTVVFWPRQPEDSAWGHLGRAIQSVTGRDRPRWELELRDDLRGLGLRLAREEDVVHTIAHASPREAWDQLSGSCSMQVLLRRVGAEHTQAIGDAWLADSGLEERGEAWVHQATARLWIVTNR